MRKDNIFINNVLLYNERWKGSKAVVILLFCFIFIYSIALCFYKMFLQMFSGKPMDAVSVFMTGNYLCQPGGRCSFCTLCLDDWCFGCRFEEEGFYLKYLLWWWRARISSTNEQLWQSVLNLLVNSLLTSGLDMRVWAYCPMSADPKVKIMK